MYTYLILNAIIISIPLLLSFDKKVAFYKKLPALAISYAVISTIFIVWDIFFTVQGYWGFNDKYLTGIKLFSLPLEEVLFFVSVPYSCVFLYETFICYKINLFKDKLAKVVLYALTLLLLGLCVLSGFKIYALSVLIGNILLIIILIKIREWSFLKHYYTAFSIVLIPFFIFNGILTGSKIEEEVVWYSVNAISGIRLFTIPIEDLFYNNIMLLGYCFVYELSMKKLRLTHLRT